jgi:hypothetical protein
MDHLPMHRFSYGQSEICSCAILELESTQRLCAFMFEKMVGLMNTNVADAQAKQPFSLSEHDRDIGGETSDKRLANLAGSGYSSKSLVKPNRITRTASFRFDLFPGLITQ